MARLQIRPGGPDEELGFRVEIFDTTCQPGSVAWLQGADSFCVYGTTSTQAVARACRAIADGTAVMHFDRERAAYIHEFGPRGWDFTNPQRKAA